ncbi:MAG: PEP-CTERM sorting domain-containing protein [Planctomycetota bacterium]
MVHRSAIWVYERFTLEDVMKMHACLAMGLAGLVGGVAQAQIATINGSGSVAGNGNSGFGGVIGPGSMAVTTLPDGTANMTLTRGTGGHFDFTAVYIDSVAGGIANTSALSDTGDPGRAGLSGTGFGGELSDLGFATGFEADFGLTIDTGFSGIFDIVNDPNNFGFVAAVSTDGTRDPNDATFNVSFNLSDIGLTAGDSFTFVASYLNSGNAFRSGEFIGSNDAGPFPADPNIGQNAYQLSDNSFVLVNTTPVPEPASLALLGLAAPVMLRRRR